MSVTKVTRRQQPKGGAPKRNGIAFAWTATQPRIELVSGRVASVANVSIVRAGSFLAADCSTGQRNIEWDNFIPILTSTGTGSGDFTVIVLANPSAAGSISHVLAQKNDAAGSPFSQITMLANANSSAGAASGNFSFFIYDSSGVGVTDTGGVDGRWHVWVGRRRGLIHDIWRDGVLRASTSSAVLNISQLTTRYLAIGSRGNGTTDAYGGDVAAALGYNLALPDDEIRGLTPETIWRLWPRRLVPRPSSFTVPSGSTYDVTLTEAATAADQAGALLAMSAAASESATAADAVAALMIRPAALTEAATATESTTTGSVASGALTEAVTAADAVSALAALSGALSESASVSDLVVAVLSAVAAVSEAASLTDEQSTEPAVKAGVSEAVSAADALSAAAQLVAAVAEAASSADAYTAAQQLVALITEPATAADAVVGQAPATYSVSITELATALDQIVAALAGDAGRNSAPPIGHGPGLSRRTPATLRRRAPNLSTRTR